MLPTRLRFYFIWLIWHNTQYYVLTFTFFRLIFSFQWVQIPSTNFNHYIYELIWPLIHKPWLPAYRFQPFWDIWHLIELQTYLPLPPPADHLKKTVKCHQTQTDQTTRALLEATRVGQPNNQPNNQPTNQPINQLEKLHWNQTVEIECNRKELPFNINCSVSNGHFGWCNCWLLEYFILGFRFCQVPYKHVSREALRVASLQWRWEFNHLYSLDPTGWPRPFSNLSYEVLSSFL